MNTRTLYLAIAAAALVGGTAGCTFPSKSSVVDRSRVGRAMHIETGDVVAVREVQVSGRNTIVGVGGGGLMGRAAASGGSGVGGAVAQAAGAVTGALVGEAVEEAATRKAAQEITIKMSNGETLAVVQEIGKDGGFAVGEHVQVMQGGAGASVRRLY
ncbi:MAG: hypothetical protein NTV51_30045 [Verrucomicrobia bacterium]|nr:hypothetical protein [Verrucomicrobiota bacterium]